MTATVSWEKSRCVSDGFRAWDRSRGAAGSAVHEVHALSLSVCLSLSLSLSVSLSHTHTHTHTPVDAFLANAALRGLLEARHYNGAGAHSSQVSAAVSLVLASPVCVFSDTKVW